MSTATVFKPTVEDFGQFTLPARNRIAAPETAGTRIARKNLLITVGFIAGMFGLFSAVSAIDAAMYPVAELTPQEFAYYGLD